MGRFAGAPWNRAFANQSADRKQALTNADWHCNGILSCGPDFAADPSAAAPAEVCRREISFIRMPRPRTCRCWFRSAIGSKENPMLWYAPLPRCDPRRAQEIACSQAALCWGPDPGDRLLRAGRGKLRTDSAVHANPIRRCLLRRTVHARRQKLGSPDL